VCGHDIGGMVALALAATHRHAITHLAIFDVPLPGWSTLGRHLLRSASMALCFPHEEGSARTTHLRTRA
jgi:pimeloyl-ACP methyl ester carboxylesterase